MPAKYGIFIVSAIVLGVSHAHAQSTLSVQVTGIEEGKPIPQKYAFCAPEGKDGGNVSPEISWSFGPDGTQSYAVIMYDDDVPKDFTDANKKGVTIPFTAPRKTFYHWVMVDIPSTVTSFAEGVKSDGVVKTGKAVEKTIAGNDGKNDFGTFMKGTFGGYDGPCPPVNDDAIHNYHFDVYALDVPTLNLKGEFDGRQAVKAMEGHILAKGTVTATYSLNPSAINTYVK